MGHISAEFMDEVRRRALPVAKDREDHAIAAAAAALAQLAVEGPDMAAWMRLRVAEWRRSGVASADLRRVLGAAIAAGDASALGGKVASRYFALHSELVSHPLYDHDDATAILS